MAQAKPTKFKLIVKRPSLLTNPLKRIRGEVTVSLAQYNAGGKEYKPVAPKEITVVDL